jgi:tetrahydromethanopterin S-methyltransferase subunit G
LLNAQENRLDTLENQLNRLPLEYVLKVDFLREIKEMHDNFKQINNKLDKLMEKILSK